MNAENKEIALILTGTLPDISGNFDDCKAFYEGELKRYAVVVDPEALPAAKADLAKLRAEVKRLDTIRIAEAKRLKQPIIEMEGKVKELTGLIQQTADKIAVQVKACEETTLARCRALMLALLGEEYTRLEVRSEYQTGAGMIGSLSGLSCLTGKGNLTKSATENIQGLAQKGRAAQDRTDGRLDRLEAACLKAGLAAPLQLTHVERFLQETDEVYTAQLDRLIKIEVERQEASRKAVQAEEERKARAVVEEEARIARARAAEEARVTKERAEREARETLAAAQKSQETARHEAETSAPVFSPPATPPASTRPAAAQPTRHHCSPPVYQIGKATVAVNCRFTVHATRPVDLEKIQRWFQKKFLEANIADPCSFDLVVVPDEAGE